MNNVKPFVVLDSEKKFIALYHTNAKGYKKSIENNALWILDQKTDRLLPAGKNYTITKFGEKPDWYEAFVSTPRFTDTGMSELLPEEKKQKNRGQGAASAPASAEKKTPAGEEAAAVIENLFNIIEQRKAERPEGSYTSHLFNSGIEKIRKKTGEEAIELVLAQKKEDVIYESADLLYHLLVMLSALEITPEEVFAELKKR